LAKRPRLAVKRWAGAAAKARKREKEEAMVTTGCLPKNRSIFMRRA